jgi:hypothetical protein
LVGQWITAQDIAATIGQVSLIIPSIGDNVRRFSEVTLRSSMVFIGAGLIALSTPALSIWPRRTAAGRRV